MDLPTQERHAALSRSGHVVALYAGLSLLAVLCAAYRGSPNLYAERIDFALVLGPLGGVAVGLAVVLITRICSHRFAWAQHLHREFRQILGPITGREIWVLAIASSVGEELLFRGALMPWIGIWPQAIIFALLHIGPGARFLPWTLMAFLMGLALGALVMATGNLGVAIACHFTVNFLNLRFIAYTPIDKLGEAAPLGKEPVLEPQTP